MANAIDTNPRSATVRDSELDGSTKLMPEEGLMSEQILERIPTPLPVLQFLNTLKPLEVEEERRLEHQFKLSYLFGGFDVACKETKIGTLIIASGPGHEVSAKLALLPDTEFEDVFLERPPTWNSLTQLKRQFTI